MNLQSREYHSCPDAQQDPPDPSKEWHYVCEECGSSWNWMQAETHQSWTTENYGFLRLRTRKIPLPLGRGFWFCMVRTFRMGIGK